MALQLRLLPRATLTARASPRLPAVITGGEGIAATRTGTTYDISLDYDELTELLLTDVPEADRDQVVFAVFYENTQHFRKVNLDELITILSSALDPNLAAIVALDPSANKGMYWVNGTTAALYDLTSFGRSLGGAADAAAGRTLLEVNDLATTGALTSLLQKVVIPPAFVTAAATYPNRKDIIPIYAGAHGAVRMSKSVSQLMEDFNEDNPDSIVYVATDGDDIGAGTRADPLATLQQAIAENAAPNVSVRPGVYNVFSFRQDTSTYAAIYKRVTNSESGKGRPVIIRVLGVPVLSDQTYALASGKTYAYKTTLSLSGSQSVHRVIFTNLNYNRFDIWGFFDRFPQVADVDAVEAAGLAGECAWAIDGADFYVSFFGLNAETYKARFRGLFTDSSGNSRCLIFGGVHIVLLGVKGDFVFDGVSPKTLDSGSNAPTLGLENVKIQYTNDHGVAVQGGLIYSSGVEVHAPLNDCFNYNPGVGGTIGTFFIEYNCRATMAGDITTFGAGSVHNLQPSSAHGGASGIRVVGPDGIYGDGNGQGIADATETGWDSLSWIFGLRMEDSAIAGAPAIGNYYSVGGTRSMWVDGVQFFCEEPTLYAEGSASAIVTKYTNCEFPPGNGPTTDSVAVITTYDRNDP